jgi:hypothetical protein
MLFNQNNEEKEAIITFRSKYVKHMVIYLEKCSDVVDSYLKGYFILNRSQRINRLKENLNFRAKYSILNNYPNEIRKLLINNLRVFIDDGDLNKLQNIQAYIPSISSSSTSNNNNNDNNNNNNSNNNYNENAVDIYYLDLLYQCIPYYFHLFICLLIYNLLFSSFLNLSTYLHIF